MLVDEASKGKTGFRGCGKIVRTFHHLTVSQFVVVRSSHPVRNPFHHFQAQLVVEQVPMDDRGRTLFAIGLPRTVFLKAETVDSVSCPWAVVSAGREKRSLFLKFLGESSPFDGLGYVELVGCES